MQKSVLKCKTPISDLYTLYRFENAAIAGKAQPGQFAEVRVPGVKGFRRPISFFSASGDCFDLLVKTVGNGTELLTKVPLGAELEISIPLGNGFDLDSAPENCVLVAGGIGLAPLNYLASELLKRGNNVFLLFSSRRDEVLLGCLEHKDGIRVLCAEDRRDAKAKLQELLGFLAPACTKVFSCGPNPFMEMVSAAAADFGVEADVSLEGRMSCGMGICLGCVVNCRTADGEEVYRTVCHDGPVFPGKEVFFA